MEPDLTRVTVPDQPTGQVSAAARAERAPLTAQRLTLVIPAYNEEQAIGPLVARLRPIVDDLIATGRALEVEVLLVDDGSSDQTVKVISDEMDRWPSLGLVELRRNAGQQQAIAAGLRAATGDWVVTMDCDLQDPPELLADMLDAATNNSVDVVYTAHSIRTGDSRFYRTAAGLYYRLVRRITEVPVEDHVGDFRLMSRAVVDTLNTLPERTRVHRLLVPYLGFPSVTLHHERPARSAGTSHYSTGRLIRLTVESVVSFTSAPLRWVTLLGLGTGFFSLLLTIGSVAAQISGISIPGWASLAVMVTFFGGVQLICTGILGEYVGRIFMQVQGRPAYEIAAVQRATQLPTAPVADIYPEVRRGA